MWVKKCWSTRDGKKYVTHHVVQSYRDEEGKVKHNYVVSLTGLPQEAIEAVRRALKGQTGEMGLEDVEVTGGDSLRGAGQMAIWRAWKKTKMEKVLSSFTEADRKSIFAMMAGRITEPCSKLALKDRCADTFWARSFSDNRLDEDVLYEVLDRLAEQFYPLQENLADAAEGEPTLMLYDTTSTYFEGTEAEGGEYGNSKDKRWDRYQIIVAVVTDGEGRPLAVEVWPGNTADCATVQHQIELLKDRFGLKKAVFVGDKGMYSEANLDAITEAGYDYIVGLEYHRQKRLLLGLGKGQLDLFAEQGSYEWQEDGVRYVGYFSERRQYRESRRRERKIEETEEELSRLQQTARKGRYYTPRRLREKVANLLEWAGVRDLWNVEIEPMDETQGPDEKSRIALAFSPNEVAIERRKAMEGRYVLATTLDEDERSAEDVHEDYKRLQRVERGFRHIKSYLKIRPIYHRLWRRIRAHVLICFLAYHLVWRMETELREAGITTEVETVLRRWDQLRLSETTVEVAGESRTQWSWSLGQLGREVRKEIKQAGMWRSLAAYRRGISIPTAPAT